MVQLILIAISTEGETLPETAYCQCYFRRRL
jgi:hypothetical protein